MDNVLNGDCMRGQRFCCVSGLQVLSIFWSFLSFCYFIQNVSFCYFIQDLHIYTKDMSPVSRLCVNQSQRNKICYQEQDRQKQKHITSGLEWPSQCKYLKRDNVTITTITRPNVNIETRSSPYDHKHDDHNHNDDQNHDDHLPCVNIETRGLPSASGANQHHTLLAHLDYLSSFFYCIFLDYFAC